ncbi:unnamed protein product, partial [marine sediment metagenome]
MYLLLFLISFLNPSYCLDWTCDKIDKDSYDVCTKSGDCVALDDCDCYVGTSGTIKPFIGEENCI